MAEEVEDESVSDGGFGASDDDDGGEHVEHHCSSRARSRCQWDKPGELRLLKHRRENE